MPCSETSRCTLLCGCIPKVVSSEFAGQFDKTLSNLPAVVREAGGSPENIARLTIYVLDRREYSANLKPLGEAYRERMGRHYPAMTLVEVKGLVEEGCRLELEGTAALRDSETSFIAPLDLR